MPDTARRVPALRPLPASPRGGVALLWLVLSSALLGCSAREEKELRDLQQRMDALVAKVEARRQNLPRDREELKEMEARADIHCAPDTPQELLLRAGQLATQAQVSVREQRDRVVWLLVTGEGSGTSMVEVMDGLARQAPFFSLEEATARDHRWTLVLRSARRCPPPKLRPYPPLPSPVNVLAESLEENLLFPSEEKSRLCQGIIHTERRYNALMQEIWPDNNLRERVDELRARVEQAERDNDRSEDGVRRRLALVHALFAVPGPGPGSLRTLQHELVYEGGIPLAEESWNERLDGAGFRVARREGERRVLIPD